MLSGSLIPAEFLTRLSKAIAVQFGTDCEVVIHSFDKEGGNGEILSIENGHVTNRKPGDGPSHIVLESLKKLRDNGEPLTDQLDYLTSTDDGRLVKSSSIYIRDDSGTPVGMFAINYDITRFVSAGSALSSFLHLKESADSKPTRISNNVDSLLEELLEESVKRIGKPVAMMTREEKIQAVRFLDEAGAFLITKSGDRAAAFLGISKYTLYNYIDAAKNKK
ncbi:MAG: helix-turn-helix transcriptional regulator [Lachnospiraceae bacterium]|nr:helix-turn-helix transcriptional regulator [Lachnospiraceae bacterium]